MRRKILAYIACTLISGCIFLSEPPKDNGSVPPPDDSIPTPDGPDSIWLLDSMVSNQYGNGLKTTKCVYDSLDRLIIDSTPYPAGGSIPKPSGHRYEYDSRGDLVSIKSLDGNAQFEYAYSQNGKPVSERVISNDINVLSYQYDARDSLVRIVDRTSSGDTLQIWDFGYGSALERKKAFLFYNETIVNPGGSSATVIKHEDSTVYAYSFSKNGVNVQRTLPDNVPLAEIGYRTNGVLSQETWEPTIARAEKTISKYWKKIKAHRPTASTSRGRREISRLMGGGLLDIHSRPLDMCLE